VSPRAESLPLLLRDLKLPSFAAHHQRLAEQAEHGGWSFADYLHELVTLELSERRTRKIARLHQASGLPREKTLATLDLERLAAPIRRRLPSLCAGDFVARSGNILAFGLPGRGKTHLLCAIGHELVERGFSVLFTPSFRLVQRLLVAKRDLALEQELRRLDHFDVVILDDLGYVQQEREEMDVLFTFLGERYERRSVMITSNLVFSQWDRIFKDALTTAAAIERLIQNATVLELTGKSIRAELAQARMAAEGKEASE
jgi:DNA replication protein DnaC